MIQLIVNVNLLREIDERKLINAYARFIYLSEEDITDEDKIKENLIKLLDWDKSGISGLEIYCGKFESIKRKDWPILIDVIKTNSQEIKNIACRYVKEKQLEQSKVIKDEREKSRLKLIEHFNDENYEAKSNGKKAKPCVYEGRSYKSRQECQFKEGISHRKLYAYLEKTNQL